MRLMPRECVWGTRRHTAGRQPRDAAPSAEPPGCPSATHLGQAELNWLLKYRPDDALVAVRGGEGPLIPIVPPKVFLRWEKRTQWQRIHLY